MKYRIEVQETVIYKHSMDFESDLTEEEINPILDKISRGYFAHHDDVICKLKEHGFTEVSFSEDEDGDIDEIEIDSLQEVGESE